MKDFFMSLLTKFFPKKQQEDLPIGIAEDETHYCIAYLAQEQPIVNFYPKSTALTEILATISNFSGKKKQIIRPVPYHYIWRKYLIQPINVDKETIFRQVIQTIKQELPIAIDEVYFDYQALPHKAQKVTQIIIYALRKRFAKPLLLDIDTVLDCELQCWQRGLHFFMQSPPQNGQTYAFKEKFFTFKLNELSIQNECNENYLSLNDLTFPENVVSKELYILALGACLWK